ncbi:hypothetical protein JW968_02655 [Candidatus Woesearchaeota archaeon]|nr:hypothetical protein [Candidatus Woesearchaeota archaeon]
MIYDADLGKMDNNELLRLFKTHDEMHTELYQWGWLPNSIDMFHPLYTELLLSYLEKKTGSKEGANKALIALTQPQKNSILADIDDELLEIGAEIEKDQSQTEVFKNNSAKAIKQKLKKEFLQKLEDYWQKYMYLGYMWLGIGKQLDVEDYIQTLKDFVGKGVKLTEQAKENKRRVLEDNKRRKEVLNELKIDDDHKNLFDLWGDFMLTKIYRRNAQIKSFFYFDKLQKEIAKRIGVIQEHLRFMQPDEVENALHGGEVYVELLNKRMEFSVYYAEKGYDEFVTGEAARELAKAAESEVDKDVTEVTGQVACLGKAKGRVKIIIRASDMHKFEQGDILVSIATDPDVVPAMKKAAAIVTEQGGVTSHAAIVSRELGTPCVIGTKIATKVFKDGDLVEVDAEKGIVRKISK